MLAGILFQHKKPMILYARTTSPLLSRQRISSLSYNAYHGPMLSPLLPPNHMQLERLTPPCSTVAFLVCSTHRAPSCSSIFSSSCCSASKSSASCSRKGIRRASISCASPSLLADPSCGSSPKGSSRGQHSSFSCKDNRSHVATDAEHLTLSPR